MFRFSVRDLLWLTLVVAVGMGWLARERWWTARELVRDQEWAHLQAELDNANAERRGWELTCDHIYAMLDLMVQDDEKLQWVKSRLPPRPVTQNSN